MMTAEAVKVYAFAVNDDGSIKDQNPTTARYEAGVEVDELVRAFSERYDVSYEAALAAVRLDPQHRELIRTYALGG